MTNVMIDESMKLLAIITILAGAYLSLKKMMRDIFSPIDSRLKLLEKRFDNYDKKKATRIEQNKVLFRAFKIVLMKLDGEHINGEVEEVKKMLDDCLIENLK